MVDDRSTFRVAFHILTGRQLHIHCRDRECSFFQNRILGTRLTKARMGQTEIKWDLITQPNDLYSLMRQSRPRM